MNLLHRLSREPLLDPQIEADQREHQADRRPVLGGRLGALLDVAIAAIGDLEKAVATGATDQPQLFKRIIEVIDMQTDPHAWKKEYDELVAKKAERLQALSPEALADLRSQWTTLVTDIRGALAEDPSSATAQAFGARWTGLLSQLMGQTVDPGALSAHQQAHEWDPRMASFVERSVWEFMRRVLAARH